MKKLICAICALCCISIHAQQTINLAGAWQFSMGETPQYDDYVMLPGSMLTNGKGNDITMTTPWTGSLYDSSYYFNPYMEKYRVEGNVKLPFFLTPDKHYIGAAWYRRTVYVPRTWTKQRIMLHLERAHIETTVYINGKQAGHGMSLSVPHRYDVTDYIKAGEKNEIAIRVYNGIENVCVGQDSHSVTDQTQGNWNGIVGRIELQARPRELNIRSVRVYPEISNRRARVVVNMENRVDGLRFMPQRDYWVNVEVEALGKKMPNKRFVGDMKEALGNTLTFYVEFGEDMQLWDEFSPALYQLTAYAGDDIYTCQFGMREISIKGRQLYLNGRPIWIRGTVENCCFPETGYPPTDEASWLRVFRKCREYGINMVRFHSYCPPEAAFSAADKVGIYLQPEGPSWPNHGVRLRRGMAIDQYLMDECKAIADEYGNHPSFVMMAAGNEPAGDWVSWCNDFVKTMRQYDPTKIYCGASVGGGWAWDSGSEYHVKGGARGLDWDRKAPQSQDDYEQDVLHPRNFKGEVNTEPYISHEKGQWCVFPDLDEVSQYTGVYKARNFEIFSDLLRDNGMASQARNFLMASGKLQTLCYKYEIERNLRTPDYAGFQLLGLNDYSGQGTALEGVLNVFWREKGYCTSADWRRFCSPLVLLARFPRFVYTQSDTLRVPLEMYNAYIGGFKSTSTAYTVQSADSAVLFRGVLPAREIPLGKNNELGVVSIPLNGVAAPAKLTLTATTGGVVSNHWDFWVYPDKLEMPDTKVYITDTLDQRAVKVLQKGGRVLIAAAGKVMLGSDVKQSYLPVFWNTSWFKMRPPHTTGAYIENSHPLFGQFPTDDWSNLNWWELLNRAQVMNLMEFPSTYQPVIQPIDTWHISRKLGMLIEANVLKGKLLMTTMDISSDLDRRVVARQMRKAILDYMQSGEFRPAITLEPQVITNLFEKESPKVSMFTNDSPDELKPKLK